MANPVNFPVTSITVVVVWWWRYGVVVWRGVMVVAVEVWCGGGGVMW